MQESIFFKITRVRSCWNGLKLYNFKNLSFTKVEIYNLTWGFASVWLRRRHCYCTLGFLKYFLYEFRMVFIVVAFFVFEEEWTMENQVRFRNHAWGEGNNQWHKRERKNAWIIQLQCVSTINVSFLILHAYEYASTIS